MNSKLAFRNLSLNFINDNEKFMEDYKWIKEKQILKIYVSEH